jgi:hypothetical protein
MSVPRRYGTCAAPFEKTYVSLHIEGARLPFDALSKRLGCEPTKVMRVGERRYAQAPSITPEREIWQRTRSAPTRAKPDPWLANDIVHAVLDDLPEETAFWEELRAEFEVEVRIGFEVATWSGCIELDPLAVERLRDLGAPVSLYFFHGGGAFTTYETSVEVYGTDLVLADLTRRFGCQPTDTREVGKPGGLESKRIAEVSKWEFAKKGAPPTPPSEIVNDVFARLPTAPDFWATLRERYDVVVRFTLSSDDTSDVFTLTARAFEQMAVTGAPVAFHYYGPT